MGIRDRIAAANAAAARVKDETRAKQATTRERVDELKATAADRIEGAAARLDERGRQLEADGVERWQAAKDKHAAERDTRRLGGWGRKRKS